MRPFILTLFFIYFYALPKLLAQQTSVSTTRIANESDLVPVDLQSKYFSENWILSGVLNDSIIITYTISINDLDNFKERVGGASLFVKWGDYKSYSVKKEYPYSNFFYNDSLKKLGLHIDRPYWIKGSLQDSITVKFKTGKHSINYDVELKLYDIIAGLIDNTPKYFNSSDFFHFKPIIINSRISGLIAINGDTLTVSGFGSLEHTHQNFNSSKKIKQQLRFFSSGISNSFDYINLILGGTNPSEIIYGQWFKKDSLLKTINITSIKPSTPTKIRSIQIYKQYEIVLDEHNNNSIDSNILKFTDENTVTSSIFDDMNFFLRKMAKSYFKVDFIQIITTGTINNKRAVVTGSIVK